MQPSTTAHLRADEVTVDEILRRPRTGTVLPAAALEHPLSARDQLSPDFVGLLPTPPSDVEKYSYLGPQKRWVLAASGAAYLFAVLALLAFSVQRPSRYPLLAIVVLMGFDATLFTLSGMAKRRVTLDTHQAKVSGWAPARLPSIDVFLPSAGESLHVLANTFDHVAGLDYKGVLQVHVLDDSGRPSVRMLADHHNFLYHARPDRGRLKKAGNLIYGYEHSSHDFIVIFDADFVPRPEILNELLPYLDDPTVGIVQSPQCFDTTGPMNWLQRAAGSTQETFYRWLQPSRDALGAPICVGTNALYRRSALEAVGGFHEIEHSEDIHTGVNMLKIGIGTSYVPVLFAKGICPDDLPGFLSQQYRWCTGSLSLLASRSFHRATALTLRQRMCFISGLFGYATSAVLLFAAPIPPLLMLYFSATEIRPVDFALLVPSILMAFVLIPNLLHAKWDLGYMRLQTPQNFAHVFAIWHILTGRTAGWVPTGIAETPKVGDGLPLAVKITRLMRGWIIVQYTALWGGVALDLGIRHESALRFAPLIALTTLLTVVQVPLLFPVRTSAELAARRGEQVSPGPLAERRGDTTAPEPLSVV